jgi:3-deoxy-D-manno-octulosonic-acid transferase
VIVLYGALLALLAPLWIPALALGMLVSPRLRLSFGERLRPLPFSTPGGVWVHAASVGESEAAAPLLRALGQQGVPVTATAQTATGRDRLRARFPGLAVRLAPLDLPGLVHLSLRRVRPRALVLVETELWPHLIVAAARAGAAVLIVSARLSDRSLPRYRLARPLFASVLRRARVILAQTAEDAARFVALGAREDCVRVGGDLKLDAPPAAPASGELLGALGRGRWLLAGSTHEGEERALLEAWEALRGSAPDLRLVLVPRHPERAGGVLELARARGHRAGLRSKGAADCAVAVVDSVGELRSLYAHAELVFAGGTLAPVGGHNLLEPVLAGRVVVVGPHTENQRAQVELLQPYGVLVRIDSSAALRDAFAALLRDPERDARASRARERIAAHRGAASRALAEIHAALATGSGAVA